MSVRLSVCPRAYDVESSNLKETRKCRNKIVIVKIYYTQLYIVRVRKSDSVALVLLIMRPQTNRVNNIRFARKESE